MANRFFTLLIGLLYLGLGICGLIPSLVWPAPPEQAPHTMLVTVMYGYLFGVFPMNIISDIFFIIVGAVGIWTARRVRSSRHYEQFLFGISLLFVIMGFLPFQINRIWGLMPLFEWIEAIFLFTVLFSFYFAFLEGPTPDVLGEPVFRQ